MKVQFSDGLVKEMTKEEYEQALHDSFMLKLAAEKNGYTPEEAEEMYSLGIIE